jgi:hypothetical protein
MSPLWKNLGRISSLLCFGQNFNFFLYNLYKDLLMECHKAHFYIPIAKILFFNLAKAQLCLFSKSLKTFVYSAKVKDNVLCSINWLRKRRVKA